MRLESSTAKRRWTLDHASITGNGVIVCGTEEEEKEQQACTYRADAEGDGSFRNLKNFNGLQARSPRSLRGYAGECAIRLYFLFCQRRRV